MYLSIVIPCLDEAETIGLVVEEVRAALSDLSVDAEVLVVDDGSVDDSAARAEAAGARVITTGGRRTGYGNALVQGAHHASGEILVFLDADGEHDARGLPRLVEAAEASRGLVLGSRALGGYEAGARSWLNRAVGTPLLSALVNHFLGTRITDCNTGYRAIPKAAFDRLDLRRKGFEVASEMIARASIRGVSIVEVPMRQRPARDGRASHLRRWRDGWRHLETIFLHAPDRVLLRPGLLSIALGLALFAPQVFGPVAIGALRMDIHLMILGALLLLVGVEMAGSAVVCASLAGDPVAGRRSWRLRGAFRLERVAPVAGVVFLCGLIADVAVVVKSGLNGWAGIMEPRLALVGTTAIVLSVQLLVLSFVHTVVAQRR